jgi:hypothetical protein
VPRPAVEWRAMCCLCVGVAAPTVAFLMGMTVARGEGNAHSRSSAPLTAASFEPDATARLPRPWWVDSTARSATQSAPSFTRATSGAPCRLPFGRPAIPIDITAF